MSPPRRRTDPLRVRWLGRVPYREALAVQQALFDHGREQHLLLLEHDHVFTYGQHADLATNLRCDPAAVGADLVAVNRGGDITYHGPGQLVGYPILSIPNAKGSLRHVVSVEALLIDVLAELGVPGAGRLPGYPGVWVDAAGDNPRKIAAIGVRLARGRTMHGFALNVTTDMAYMRDHIVACGIADRPVTSLAEEGIDVSIEQVVDVVARLAAQRWGTGRIERQDVAWHHRPDDLVPFSRGAGPGERVAFRPRSHARLATGRRHDGHVDRDAQARLVATQGPTRPGGDAAQAQRARARPGHGVRGRRLPQPVGVLVRRHGDADAAR